MFRFSVIFCSEMAPGRDRALWSNFVKFRVHFGLQNGSENHTKTLQLCSRILNTIFNEFVPKSAGGLRAVNGSGCGLMPIMFGAFSGFWRFSCGSGAILQKCRFGPQ